MDIPVDLCLEVLMAADFLRMDSESETTPQPGIEYSHLTYYPV